MFEKDIMTPRGSQSSEEKKAEPEVQVDEVESDRSANNKAVQDLEEIEDIGEDES